MFRRTSTAPDLNFTARHNLIDMSWIKLIGSISLQTLCCLAINIVIEKVPMSRYSLLA